MKRIITFFVAVVVLMSFTASNQNTLLDIVSKLKNSEAQKGSEKLFLHLDRPLYFAGETIWFQSYLVNAASHLPITYEKILYVELINSAGVTTSKQMFKLENGKCNGNIILDDELASGKYLLVANTNWMRNQGAEFFFKQEVKILNDEEQSVIVQATDVEEDSAHINTSQSSSSVTTQAQLQLSFMPEGGELIAGLNSRVAFEGVNQAGKAMDFSGVLVNGSGQFQSVVRPLYDGKGFFIFSPKVGEQYKVLVEGNQGKQLEFLLPEVKSKGYALAVENRFKTDSLGIFIHSANVELGSEIVLIAQQDGAIKEVVQARLSKNVVRFKLDKALFSTGVAQLTLFNKQMVPLCERLVFVNNNDQLKIKIDGFPSDVEGRDKLALNVEVSDKDGNPMAGEFSVSVTDAAMIDDSNYSSVNLVNHMLLSANVPGRISNPALYMQQTSMGHSAMDLLMLTNGWRRFKWQEVLADSLAKPKHPLEQGIFVEGKLKRKGSGKNAPKGIEVTMMLRGQSMDVYSVETDENGEFQFAVRDFTDTVDVLVQTRNRLNNKADFSIDLESNLRFEAADYNARKLMLVGDEVPTTFYQSDDLKEGEARAVRGAMREQYQRLAEEGFFQDTTDILMDDIEIKAEKKKTAQEKMAVEYGAPSYVLGQRQIEDLVKEKPWNDGLVSILYDAIPGLRVFSTQLIDNEGFGSQAETDSSMDGLDSLQLESEEFSSVGNDRTVEFVMTSKSQRRFYIFVDSELIGMTDANGVLEVMNTTYSFDDFITMDPLAIKSIELIMNPKESPLFDVFIDNMQDFELGGSAEAIFSIYTKNGTGIFSRSYNKGMTNFRLYGFERVREFYSPKYDGTDDAKYITDERATILWEPVLKTDSTGKAIIEFYNSDVASKWRVDIAGFSSTGIPGASIIVEGQDRQVSSSLNVGSTTTGNYEDFTEESSIISNQNLFQGQILLNGKTLNAYASIGIKGKTWSTISNSKGKYLIDKDMVLDTDTLQISVPSIGYSEVVYSRLIGNNGTISLESDLLDDNESLDAGKIVQQMIRKRRSTTMSKSHYIHGAYREAIGKGGDLYGLLDFSFIQNKEGYATSVDPHRTMPVSGRYYRTEDYNMQIKYKPLNTLEDLVPVLDPWHKDLSFLNDEYRKQYDFELVAIKMYQGREVYQISFDQKADVNKAFYQGTLLVDKQNLGLAHVKWKLSAKGKKYEIPQMYLMPAEKMNDFKSLNENNEAAFVFEDGLWKLKMAVQQLEFSINNTKLSFNREMVVTEDLTKRPENFKFILPEKMKKRRMLIKDVSYRPEFWRKAWCIPSENYIDKQIKHLHEVVFYN